MPTRAAKKKTAATEGREPGTACRFVAANGIFLQNFHRAMRASRARTTPLFCDL